MATQIQGDDLCQDKFPIMRKIVDEIYKKHFPPQQNTSFCFNQLSDETGAAFITVRVTPFVGGGDHFSSICEAVTVTVSRRLEKGPKIEKQILNSSHHDDNHRHQNFYDENLNFEIHLFTKRMVSHPEHARILRELRFFEKEAGFFNFVLPALKNLIETRNKNFEADYKLDVLPTCYFASEDLVVMENLDKIGYKVADTLDRKRWANEMAVMTMKTLAKFHAPSCVLIGRDENFQNFLKKFPFLQENAKSSMNQGGDDFWLRPMFGVVEKLLKALEKIQNLTGDVQATSYALTMIRDHKEDLIKKFLACLKPEETGHVPLVVNHGDCWHSNQLFLCSDNQDRQSFLRHQKLVDFQMIRVASPAIDLSYYIFSSWTLENGELFHGVGDGEETISWKNLLKVYSDALKENLQQLNAPDRLPKFSFEDFVTDFREKCIYGLLMTLNLLIVKFGAAGFDQAPPPKQSSSSSSPPFCRSDCHSAEQNQKSAKNPLGCWIGENFEKGQKCARHISAILTHYRKLMDSQ